MEEDEQSKLTANGLQTLLLRREHTLQTVAPWIHYSTRSITLKATVANLLWFKYLRDVVFDRDVQERMERRERCQRNREFKFFFFFLVTSQVHGGACTYCKQDTHRQTSLQFYTNYKDVRKQWTNAYGIWTRVLCVVNQGVRWNLGSQFNELVCASWVYQTGF